MADKQPETKLEAARQPVVAPPSGADHAPDLVPTMPRVQGETGANERVGGPAPKLPDAAAAKARRKRLIMIGAAAAGLLLMVVGYFVVLGDQPQPTPPPTTAATAPVVNRPPAAKPKQATSPLDAAKALAGTADDDATEPGTKKKGRTDRTIDGFNTVLRAAEGKRDAPPPEQLTTREQAVKKEIAELAKKPVEKPATPADHPLFNVQRGDWAVYKSSKGGTQKRTIISRHDTNALVALEPGGEANVVFTKFFDPTFTQSMDVLPKGNLRVVKLGEGDELLRAGDKPYMTHWTEYTVVPWGGGDVNYLKAWMCRKVPLALVKAEHDFHTDGNLPKEERAKQRETVELVEYGGEARPVAATAAGNPPPKDTQPPAPPPADNATKEPDAPKTPPPDKTAKQPDAPKTPPVPAKEGTKAASTPPTPAKKMEKVYVLKDGRRIRALSAILADDTYLIKTPEGKMQSVLKEDVVEIAQQEAPAAEPPAAAADQPPAKDAPQPKKAVGAPAAPADQAATKDAPQPRKIATKTYVMKDGRRIVAATVMEMGEELAIKDTAGKLTVVNKADVAEIVPEGK
ncbi:MAG: hypothetical protein NTW87_13245 [Planctomycetota bacterium]|nr:hypothetical protein [Planctomycetota bacterium]